PFVLDQLIKAIIIYELHGLNDVALDTVKRFAKRLGERLDVDHAVQLLAVPDCRGHDILWNLRKRIEAYEESTSWRITAPLRWAKHFVFGSARESAHANGQHCVGVATGQQRCSDGLSSASRPQCPLNEM